MLVDAAKHGDVEIPVFCYEPKLGDPVGACRMCLVEIEGIPKLQTACSTPVRDGMVVYTQNDRVKEAQNAVVEFLLVNHPLDCPVCDKGGECPLQDIAMGWGAGKSRVTDPKRHFQKPIPLSPLIRIDRERCILCYRCVRFSQEVSEDEQLQLLERGDQDLRRHPRGPALHRPLPRQHHRALPGRRADLAVVPLPRPALGHRGRRLGLHALPEPVQRQVHRPRREGRPRPRSRQRAGRRRLALRQGPLRLPDVLQPRPAADAAGRRRRQPRAGELGGGARDGRPRPRPGDRPDRSDRRRRHLERGGLADPAARPRGARLRRRRLDRPPRARPRGPDPARLPRARRRHRRHRRRRRDPRPRLRPDARDADRRAADPQGGPPQRREAARRDRAPDRPRRRRRDRLGRLHRGAALRARRGARLHRGPAGGDRVRRRRRRRCRLRRRAPRRRAGRDRLGRGDPRRRRSRAGRRGAARPRRRPRPRRQRGRRALRDPRARRTAAASARSAAPRTPGPAIAATEPGRSADEIRAALEAGELDARDPRRRRPGPRLRRSRGLEAGARRREVHAQHLDVRRRLRPGRRRPPAGREPRREGGDASPIRTAACSASAPRSPAPARFARSGRRSASCRAGSATIPARGRRARSST